MRSDPMRSWEEKINGETEEKKMNRQADFTVSSSSSRYMVFIFS